MMGKKTLIIGLCVVASWSLVYAQGYRMASDRIVVEGEDWNAWEAPKDVLERDEDGWLKSRFVRKNVNACLDARRFSVRKEYGSSEWIQGGPSNAGSNFEDVAYVMDGDLSTFWEPNKDDPLEDWWFEINLGRLVSATKIVLKFVEEGQGDPFLQFKVGVSSGYKGWRGDRPLFYEAAGETIQPNENQRVFEFELSLPVRSGAEEFPGTVAQYVRVQVTDTKGDSREAISMEEYDALDPDWRGAVEYYRITAAGEERLTNEEEYKELSPEEQGPVRYYRREVPRLAEVEVWSIGENLGLGILDRGRKRRGGRDHCVGCCTELRRRLQHIL